MQKQQRSFFYWILKRLAVINAYCFDISIHVQGSQHWVGQGAMPPPPLHPPTSNNLQTNDIFYQ